MAQARRNGAALDPSVFDFLHQLLTCDLVAEPRSGFSRVEVVRVAMRAQQYSGPVMAKGLEDTAFYRYNRMLALNEVGGHPDQFSVSVSAFHHANVQRAKRTPHAMLSTATHDTKRGEDTRARLAVLSEIPDEWAQHVALWSRMLQARNAGNPDAAPPDRNDEYAFYQLLLGAWPAQLSAGQLDPEEVDSFRQRIEGAITKAMREAKVHTTWAAPNAAYEDAVLEFIRYALDTSRTNPFLESFSAFQQRVATFGGLNSLIQVVLKLTAPGVPDLYQGSELWDFSMVDPDNRRPVDYDIRKALLASLELSRGDLPGLLENWRDGRLKLRLIAETLALRRREPELFMHGSYEALRVTGPQADRLCAFMRTGESSALVTAVALYPSRGHGADTWGDCTLTLSSEAAPQRWTELFSGRQLTFSQGSLLASDLFASLPVALLTPS
jgi:(1->4)-alpha-D-glucan 1-alpha-D-glucosylmutase